MLHQHRTCHEQTKVMEKLSFFLFLLITLNLFSQTDAGVCAGVDVSSCDNKAYRLQYCSEDEPETCGTGQVLLRGGDPCPECCHKCWNLKEFQDSCDEPNSLCNPTYSFCSSVTNTCRMGGCIFGIQTAARAIAAWERGRQSEGRCPPVMPTCESEDSDVYASLQKNGCDVYKCVYENGEAIQNTDLEDNPLDWIRPRCSGKRPAGYAYGANDDWCLYSLDQHDMGCECARSYGDHAIKGMVEERAESPVFLSMAEFETLEGAQCTVTGNWKVNRKVACKDKDQKLCYCINKQELRADTSEGNVFVPIKELSC